MKNKKKLSGWAKAGIIAGSVVVFLLLLMLGAELWAKQKIRKTVEKEAFEIAGTPVDVRVGRIGVSIPTMTLSVRNIRLKSQNDDPRHDAALVSLDAGVGKISLRGVGYKKVDGKPAISANTLLIDNPHGTIVTKTVNDDTEKPKENKSIRQLVTEKLNSVTVDNIKVRDAGVDFVAWTTDDENTRLVLAGGDVTVRGLRIDSVPSPDKVLFSDRIMFDAGKVSYGYAAGSMVAEIDTISVSTDGRVSIAAFRLIPQYPKDEFAQKSKEHQDWTIISVAGIECYGIDFPRLASEQVVQVDSVRLASADVASYKNRQVPQPEKVKPMVYQTLQQLPVKVDIDKISFSGVAVEYSELSETGTEPGVVNFDRGRGTVANFTNIVEGHDPYFTVNVAATMMDSGDIQAACYFPVSPSNNHFRVTGQVGRTDMTSFNPVLTPLMNIKMNSGTMNSLVFDLEGSLEESHIEVTMLYDDLSVALLKPDDHSKERGFLTFIADDILIRSDNPAGNGKVRSGSGSYKRDPYKSMYNYMWKSFVPGIVKIVL